MGSGLREGWEIRKLGEAATVSAGNSAPQKKELFNNGIFPFIRTSDVGKIRKGIIDTSSDYLNKDGIKKLRLFKKGTILFPKSGASTFLNHRVIMNIDAYVSSHLATIKSNNISKDEFIWYYLITIDAKDLMQDIAYPSLKLSDIKQIPIPIPPLQEQEKIVTILDEAFLAIAKAKENAELNLQNAKELFDSFLQGVFENKGDGWEEKTLSELCIIKHGFAFKSQYFSDNSDYLLLTPGNFYEAGGYRNRGHKQKYYNGEFPTEYILEKGNLLIVMTEQAAGLLGSPLIVPSSNKFLHNQRLGLVISKSPNECSNEFLFHIFNTNSVRKNLYETGTGIKVRHTSPTKIGNVVISYPTSLEVQKKIVKTLKHLQKETKKLESIYTKKLQDLEELKKSILQKAFNGELT